MTYGNSRLSWLTHYCYILYFMLGDYIWCDCYYYKCCCCCRLWYVSLLSLLLLSLIWLFHFELFYCCHGFIVILLLDLKSIFAVFVDFYVCLSFCYSTKYFLLMRTTYMFLFCEVVAYGNSRHSWLTHLSCLMIIYVNILLLLNCFYIGVLSLWICYVFTVFCDM